MMKRLLLAAAVVSFAAPANAEQVAVTGDPTRDVTVLERPSAVIKGGRLIPRS